MDNEWIKLHDKSCDQYLDRIDNFIQFANNHVNAQNHIRCPSVITTVFGWQWMKSDIGHNFEHIIRRLLLIPYQIQNFLSKLPYYILCLDDAGKSGSQSPDRSSQLHHLELQWKRPRRVESKLKLKRVITDSIWLLHFATMSTIIWLMAQFLWWWLDLWRLRRFGFAFYNPNRRCREIEG